MSLHQKTSDFISSECVKSKSYHFWTISKTIQVLNELCYFERASAHILSGWNPKIPHLELKTISAIHLFQDMSHANQLHLRLEILAKYQKIELRVPIGWMRLVERIDRSKDVWHLLSALYLIIKQRIVEIYHSYLENSDPLADQDLMLSIRRILTEKQGQIQWAKEILHGKLRARESQKIAVDIESLWKRRSTGRLIEPRASPLPVGERVRRVARPPELKRGKIGGLKKIPIDGLRNRKDIGLFLHGFLNEEYLTMELICRNIYEHPDMPWQYHMDMARHASDEARHAKIIERAASHYGVKYGDYPIYVASYEGQYEFQPCPPGSKKELLWRILLRQTFHEGLALDSLAFEVKKRKFLRQPELAQIFSYLLMDEVFHAQSGLKWSRYLCDGDPKKAMQEREIAHNYFVDMIKVARAVFVAENEEAALEEIKVLKMATKNYDLPFHRTLNVQGRKDAGFLDEELSQIVEWGYVQPSSKNFTMIK